MNFDPSSTAARKKCTMREFFAYRLQDRPNQFSLPLNGRRLFQQLLVDKYTMVESQKLHFIRGKQSELRSDTYESLRNLKTARNSDASTSGQRVILPSSFTSGTVYTIEFQKRGLSHAHICLFITPDNKIHNPSNIDNFILSEIPDKVTEPDLYQLASDHMLHGPCGEANPNCSCMIDRECSKNFPKRFQNETSIDSNGFPLYKRRDNGRYVVKKGINLDNRSVVPYNKILLRKYQDHINVEWCNQEGLIKYLSACEASWRIFSFDVHYRVPAVTRLPFHLPGQQQVIYGPEEDIEDVLIKTSNSVSMFTGCMEANRNYEHERRLSYAEFPTQDACYRRGLLDDDKEYIEAIEEASCTANGYYLRNFFATMLITSSLSRPDYIWDNTWQFLVDGILYQQQKKPKNPGLSLSDEQLKNLELLQIEDFLVYNNSSLRRFSRMPFSDQESVSTSMNPLMMEELSYDKDSLSNDFKLLYTSLTDEQKSVYNEIFNSVKREIVLNVASSGITSLLLEGGRTAHSRFLIPINLTEDSQCQDEAPKIHKHAFEALDRTVKDVMNVDLGNTSGSLFGGKVVVLGGDFRQILPVVQNGTRNDCVNATISSSYIWLNCKVLKLTKNMRLTVGSQMSNTLEIKQFTDLLLDIGQENAEWKRRNEEVTDENVMLIEKLIQAEMIIKSLEQEVKKTSAAPKQGENENIPTVSDVNVEETSSERRAKDDEYDGDRSDVGEQDYDFNDEIVNVERDGENVETEDRVEKKNIEENVATTTDIATDVLIDTQTGVETEAEREKALRESDNPRTFVDGSFVPAGLANTPERALLSPLNDVVQEINDRMLAYFPGQEKEYLSSDNIDEVESVSEDFDPTLYSPDFLNGIKMSGMPNHRLLLKVGVPIMLLRNINQKKGLFNETRLQVVSLGKRVIEAKVVYGTNILLRTLLSRISLTPSDKKLPFKLIRRQFPISFCFAMTINKSQGQSLSRVGLYLKDPVFTHGQLYVALSRVKTREGIKIVLLDKESKLISETKNVMYKEIFGNLV
ncbi:uncharacterized protein LOC143582659 [Bidens hawaiensis]|uniref:uncharacterized protein LOC143582659 n=1 Tax=Bidens hawaiensis TaxID=980011 RepID=UPI00404902A1